MENREIKFKIYYNIHDGVTQHFIFSYDQIFNGNAKRYLHEMANIKIIGKVEYTGLKDKDGKEIYEGDVVQSGKERQVIEFSSKTYVSSGGQSYYVSNHWGYHLYSKNYMVFNPEMCKIIGNVFENPELIKE